MQPGQKYYYRTCSQEILLYQAYKKVFGNTARTELREFTLPAAGDDSFTAVVFNDLHKEDRYAVTLHAFGQFADKGCCLIVIGGVVYTIAVEHYKIIVNPLYLFTMPETSSIM